MQVSSAQCFWFILLLQAIKHSKPCADIVFVLDGSGSIKREFKQVISMASDVAKQFDIEKKGHRIAILEFSSKAILPKWRRYHFDQIKTNDEMEEVIQNLPHIRGATDTGRALRVVIDEFLPHRQPSSPFLVLVITDGYYRDIDEVKQNVANLIAKSNVQLFAATVSKLHNMRGLLLLANNDPSHIVANMNSLISALKLYDECFDAKKAKLSQNLGWQNESAAKLNFRSARFAHIPSPRAINIANLAGAPTTTPKNIPVKSTTRPGCLLDVVFLIDFSGGASDKRNTYIDFTSNLVRSLNINKTSAQVAAVYYSGPKRARTQFHLRKHSTAEEAIKDLHQTPSNGGTTRTGEAIYYAINEFDERFGARKDAKKMMIIFTDGYSQDTYSSKNFKKLQDIFDEYSRRCKL
ncbi:unnamed protein product [Litomosoides sigmodontis]|uniref:VWFA domain-containing protein n=1 Tax=Litomosoides sigmodontis TaxID=42156 RepID=A0A3P6TK57_LITSI|nr:unnamed protein product [Litomosoides sigmodontis]